MKALRERIARNSLEDLFGDILVPTEEVMEIKDGVKRMTERKFFPGYVLVQMDMNEESWHLVKSTPKVLGFIGGTPDKPQPISDQEAAKILNRVTESVEKPRPKTLFDPGESVRVKEGPFADFSGVVEEVPSREGLRRRARPHAPRALRLQRMPGSGGRRDDAAPGMAEMKFSR